jgi:hypothetical protein
MTKTAFDGGVYSSLKALIFDWQIDWCLTGLKEHTLSVNHLLALLSVRSTNTTSRCSCTLLSHSNQTKPLHNTHFVPRLCCIRSLEQICLAWCWGGTTISIAVFLSFSILKKTGD